MTQTAPTVRALEPTTSEDRVHAVREALRDAIVDRRLAPGAKLSENEVASLFDVGRAVARSALQMLTFEGLAYAIYDYPDMVEDMVETACVLVEDELDQVLGEGAYAEWKHDSQMP